jgi:uncharacterized lipoprotein YmbA
MTAFTGLSMNCLCRSTAVLFLAFLTVSTVCAGLSPEDLKRLSGYDKDWELAVVPEFGRARIEKQLQTALADARRDFGGRGTEVAAEFLGKVNRTPPNTAYFFVLHAVGDRATALALMAALIDPPRNGNTLGRDTGEISVALEAVLGNDPVRTDSRVISAIADIAARQSAQHNGYAPLTVQLLGQCRGPAAVEALRRFAASPDPELRRAAADALGLLNAGAPTESAQATATTVLTQTLKADPDRRARISAAASLASSAAPESLAALREALQTESDPEAVDAIVNALVRLRQPLGDALACWKIAERCWDGGVARAPFACWLASADREDVLRAAQSGPRITRALALHNLVGERETPQTVLVRVPPPPVPLASDQPNARLQRTVTSSSGFVLTTNATAGQFDTPVRDALLRAAVAALSTRVTSSPSASDTISYTTAHMLRSSLWELSERKMAVALAYADSILPLESRYSTSYDLASKDRGAYSAYRRPRQLALATLLAFIASALLLAPRFRAVAPYLIGAAVLWLAWTAFQTDIRELPPAPLNFLTASFLAFASAGIVCAMTGRLRVSVIARAFLALTGSGLLGLLVCGWTRSSHLFPVGAEGWEMIFDPLASALIAVISAVVLLFLTPIQRRLA